MQDLQKAGGIDKDKDFNAGQEPSSKIITEIQTVKKHHSQGLRANRSWEGYHLDQRCLDLSGH